LNEPVYQTVKQHAMSTPQPLNQKTKGWQREIIKDSAEIRISSGFYQNIPSPFNFVVDQLRIATELDWPSPPVISMIIYKWLPGSYIPLHDDSHCRFAFSYYLNDVWHPDWGGDLLIDGAQENGTQGGFLSPIKNRMVVVKGGVKHKTSIVSKSANPRWTIQGFVRTEEDLKNYEQQKRKQQDTGFFGWFSR
jgi:hypothetical protein